MDFNVQLDVDGNLSEHETADGADICRLRQPRIYHLCTYVPSWCMGQRYGPLPTLQFKIKQVRRLDTIGTADTNILSKSPHSSVDQ